MAGKTRGGKAFLENGSMLLEKLVAACNGRPIPIRIFSYHELVSATNNFDSGLVLRVDAYYIWYKGSHEGRTISIKKHGSNPCPIESIFTDIAISAKIRPHKHAVKLIGCCLETPLPILVYESITNGTLAARIYASDDDGVPQQRRPMAWQRRLKIARDISHAISYLHTAFSRPIIHRQISVFSIVFDQHDVPKLSNFFDCITIPKGETCVCVSFSGYGRGHQCPNYVQTPYVTEKTDVYSFGVLLLVLLTGRRAPHMVESVRNRRINEIVDAAILAEGGADMERQLQAVLQLALACVDLEPEIRPTMVDVAKELRRIDRTQKYK
ncbi:hypothetical protein CIPAW_11G148000 [Carya illinoinensis]|uniref:Protein kinase domain-containing protein n=1 Tax=Carya illinoinensis TaxID=32201 RepID=A0A8T1P6G4_CARIL|nr:hypothetical protein CIPAW_11G148000 [Carya illinoinensis]